MVDGFRQEMHRAVAEQEIGPSRMSASEAQFGVPIAVVMAVAAAANGAPHASIVVDRNQGGSESLAVVRDGPPIAGVEGTHRPNLAEKDGIR